jgi:hypothetical protein
MITEGDGTGAAEVYLGDGVYASYDGFMIRLRAPRGDGDHEIYFDPKVLAEFERFVARLKQEGLDRS